MNLYEMPAYRVIWQTRRLFQRLGSELESLHRGHGLSTSQRAVLEFLDRQGAQTVPEMARHHGVSRQHIQTLVNDLLRLGCVEAVPNPAHRRSSLIRMTELGRDTFRRIKTLDAAVVEAIGHGLAAEDLHITERTLQAMERFFRSGEWRAFKATHSPEENQHEHS